MACDDWFYSVITLLDPPPPCHAQHCGSKDLAVCTSVSDWHVHRRDYDSIDCGIHICGGGEGKATARTLWSVWGICASIWTLQHRLGCWLHRWAYLGGFHPGESWLVDCHLDSGRAERCERASDHGLHRRAHIEETLAQVDSSCTGSNRSAS
jgi:hypothetical protein